VQVITTTELDQQFHAAHTRLAAMPTSVDAALFTGSRLPDPSIEVCGLAVNVINKAIGRTRPRPLTATQAAVLQNSVYHTLTELALTDRAELRAITR